MTEIVQEKRQFLNLKLLDFIADSESITGEL
jgi:hypothetical protein